MIKEFRDFIARGNVMDLAVGIIIGAAFTAIVNSLVNDLINPLIYLRRRFIPPPDDFFLLQEHTVTEGQRLDTISNQYLGDPEQFWRLCDANGVMQPNELTDTVGGKIRITLPEGVPGYNYA